MIRFRFPTSDYFRKIGLLIVGVSVLLAIGLLVLIVERKPEPTGDALPAAMGWIDDAEARAPIIATATKFADTPAYRAYAGDEPKAVYLWDSHRKLTGQNPPEHDQNPVGSCVSFGTSRAIERTLAAELVGGFTQGEFRHLVEEVVYAGSRVEVGGGRIRGDGSVGAWAAQFVTRWGVVPRGVHGSLDLTKYDTTRCRQWGSIGVPAELETIARQFPVKDAALVRNWTEAKRALAQGYGIAICSSQGFTRQRDANGVCRPSGVWQHCMALDGYHVESGREYGHIENSWGDSYHTGPTGWGSPNRAGFWADSSTIDRMLRQGDSWAFSGTTGFPARLIDWDQFGMRKPRPAEFRINWDDLFVQIAPRPFSREHVFALAH